MEKELEVLDPRLAEVHGLVVITNVDLQSDGTAAWAVDGSRVHGFAAFMATGAWHVWHLDFGLLRLRACRKRDLNHVLSTGQVGSFPINLFRQKEVRFRGKFGARKIRKRASGVRLQWDMEEST